MINGDKLSIEFGVLVEHIPYEIHTERATVLPKLIVVGGGTSVRKDWGSL